MPSPHSPKRARRRAAAAIRLALVTAVVALPVACDDGDRSEDPSAPPAAAGLVVLSGDPGAASLSIRDASGTPRDVPLPEPSTAWISVGRRGTLVATLDDGTLRASDSVRLDRAPTWTGMPRDVEVDLPEDPLYFATWSPNGERIVASASDFAEAGRLTMAVLARDGDASLLLPVPRRPLPAPAAWVDDERLLVQTTVGLVVVDTRTGDTGLGPQLDLGFGIGLAIAADGSSVAIAPEAGRIEIRDLDGWLTGDRGEPLGRIDGQGEVGMLAFDRRGERLAVVWQQPDGPGFVTIHRRGDGWDQAERFNLPGESARAVVDWLP